jgi:shikimate dehydrogenase
MSPDKDIYGLIGYPVAHSLSPAMHEAAFASLKINAEYRLFPLKPQELESFLRSIPKKNIRGLNVTVPYKEKVMPFLGTISREARLIQAVNTIKVTADGGLEGLNTDAPGFLKHLTVDLQFNPAGKSVALLGAGGAAKAVGAALAGSGAKNISVYDIDADKRRELIKILRDNFAAVQIKEAISVDGLNIAEAGLLVNATPVGMKEGDPLLLDAGLLHPGIFVYDLVYNIRETGLLRAAREKGCRFSNGLGMLLYQGASSFEAWTGKAAPIQIMREALRKGAGIA